MLAAIALFAAAAGAIRPDDFVLEVVEAKNAVAHDLGVVNGPPVEMEKQRAVFFQERFQRRDALLQEIHVLAETVRPAVAKASFGAARGKIALGEEGWVDVYKAEAFRLQIARRFESVAMVERSKSRFFRGC